MCVCLLVDAALVFSASCATVWLCGHLRFPTSSQWWLAVNDRLAMSVQNCHFSETTNRRHLFARACTSTNASAESRDTFNLPQVSIPLK